MRKGLGVFLIIVGTLIAIYFFTLGYYIIGGLGVGMVVGSISGLNAMRVGIVSSEICEENNKKIIKVLLQNVTNKNGEVNVYVNILEEGQIIASLVSNTLFLNAQSQGVAIVDVSNYDIDKEKINYNITRISCRKL